MWRENLALRIANKNLHKQINTQVYPDDPSPIPQNIDNMIRTYSVYRSFDENSIRRLLLTHVKQGLPELRNESMLQCAIAPRLPRAVETTWCDIHPTPPNISTVRTHLLLFFHPKLPTKVKTPFHPC